MFRKIRKWIVHFLINREIRRNIRVKRHLDFDKVRSVGIVFLLEDENRFNQLNRLVKGLIAKGKEVKMLGYFPGKIVPNFFIQKLKIDLITKKDINLFGLPKSEKAKVFIQNEFDILIDFTAEEVLIADYICGISRAHFKVGRYREEMVRVFDFMIKTTETMDYDTFIKATIDYLSILNTTK
jgi:hypothetical protein